MTDAPVLIDNREGNTLAAALARLLRDGVPDLRGRTGEGPVPPARLDVATAFFSVAGFDEIALAVADLGRLRLLLGAEPMGLPPPPRPLDETPQEHERRLLRERLTELERGLRADRDRVPFTRAGRESLRRLIALHRDGTMETRRYDRAFLHAKAYILSPPADRFGAGAGVVVGSSNLTRAGLTTNLELNLGAWEGDAPPQAQAWFERLWEDATPFGFPDLLEEVFQPWTPFEIFLKVLFQLYGSEVAEDATEDGGLPLTNFQKHGAARALRLIRDSGGAIVADEVGLGKTFIAGEILKLYLDRRQRCLLVCPAQLRDTTWRKFLSDFMLKNVECVSYEQLALDGQIGLAEPHLSRSILERPLDEYQLVVVDEAHNYRNPDAPTRAQVLRTLLYGRPRDLLLLTATPVNNSLWDLYHLLRYYIRQDSFLADRGILSIRDRFTQASREDPHALSPDLLYPIIDATTVKRTRAFVKRHYGGDTIRLPDGTNATIVFPEPRAISVTYPLPDPFPALFDKIERALNPSGGEGALTFARYYPDAYRQAADEDGEVQARAASVLGLLRSGLLKRFESSAHAFRRTLIRLLEEHGRFLRLLDQGWVASTAALRALPGADDEDLESVLAAQEDMTPVEGYDVATLRASVLSDADVLRDLCDDLAQVTPERDPKLVTLLQELETIAADAQAQAVDEDGARQLRKVIVFSFFADTVRYLREELARAVATRAGLADYRERLVAVAGSGDVEEAEVGRRAAVEGFAPLSMQAADGQDRFDLLLATDVLAEGVNLQQCRHIINYDVPWNPMRLVQRHGRVDRIGSPHPRVFLRTVFPAERLDQLLGLEERILQKIALAAASVGVVSPVQGGAGGGQVFAETREEIERLLAGDASLFERGATGGGGQSGEEYRQTLRTAMERQGERLVGMPAGVGSGMQRGDHAGVLFCAAVGERTYLRFLPTEADWQPRAGVEPVREVGTCLRLIECEEATERHVPAALEEAVFDLWPLARADIHAAWMRETDPANLQPRIRPLNRRVAEFIRANPPPELSARAVEAALDILEAPWPFREEAMLRGWFMEEGPSDSERARRLVERVNASGLAPYVQPPLLPPIEPTDIQLVCWLGLCPS